MALNSFLQILIASRDSFCLKIPTVLDYCTELSVVQVVQKQELRATFEKYGIVDEVYIAQAGEHAHCSCFSTP
jgi:hypothetical protein